MWDGGMGEIEDGGRLRMGFGVWGMRAVCVYMYVYMY